MKIFEQSHIGNLRLRNRLIRSATYEGMCDKNGFPLDSYYSYYTQLSSNGIGAIITGFAYISLEGRSMQPGQAGIDDDRKIPYYRKLTDSMHKNNAVVFMQIAHTGRQSMKKYTKNVLVAPSAVRSYYYLDKPYRMSVKKIHEVADQFGQASYRAKLSGFDGIQLHAGHGYLVHQFLLPSVNKRKDEFGIHNKGGSKFFELIIDKVREYCGKDFPLIVKISGSDDHKNNFSLDQLHELAKMLEVKKVDAIEVSYGTMDLHALNIFRGDIPKKLILQHNPLFKTKANLLKKLFKNVVFSMVEKKHKAFSPMYNLTYAQNIKNNYDIPVILVGGIKSRKEIDYLLEDEQLDFVSMCRPFIAEPDLVSKLSDKNYTSICCSCNYCAVMCDSDFNTKCYKN